MRRGHRAIIQEAFQGEETFVHCVVPLPPDTDGAKCQKQNPVPDPGLVSRLPQRTQIQGGPRHLSDHESGR